MPNYSNTIAGNARQAALDALSRLGLGKAFFIDSVNGAAGNTGLRPDAALLTTTAALALCSAGRGDVIVAMPGHTETLSAAAAIALNVAGVTLQGLGVGNNRPIYTFGTLTGASMVISAANCRVKNIIGLAALDGLTGPFTVTGDNCEIDIEWHDASSAIEAATVIDLDTANNCKVNLTYQGFTAGNAAVRVIRVDDCDNVDITIKGYGVVSTAWVNFVDVASTNVTVSGTLYTSGVTTGARNVVDTITGSTWSAEIFDVTAGARFSGGSGAALAADDVSALATSLATLQAEVSGAAGLVSFPAAAAPANAVSLAEVIRAIYDRQIGNATTCANNTRLGNRVNRASADVITGSAVPIFTVAGGRILLTQLIGKVTTIIGAGASNAKFQFNPTTGTTNDMCANLDIDADEAGTLYSLTGTPATAMLRSESGAVAGMLNSGIILDVGDIEFLGGTDRTGEISFQAWWIPLDDGATLVAA